MEQPILSICIPTYNRAEYLEGCLEAIVNQDCFDDRVEVVISDNCSTDNTQEVGEAYQKKYSNIHYFRNEKNLIDQNYPLVFQRATGLLKKLTNDTVRYKPGAIKYMLTVAEENKEKKPQIYFLNKGNNESKRITSVDSYIAFLGYHLTWIASVAIWDDNNALDLFEREAHTRLAQVPFLLDDFEKRGKAVICDKIIMDVVSPKNKNLTYGLYNVFYTVFFRYIRPYLENGKLSKYSYEHVKKVLLFDFFIGWIVNKEIYSDKYNFSDEDLRGLIEETYKNEPYFDEYKKKLRIFRIKERIKKLLKRS